MLEALGGHGPLIAGKKSIQPADHQLTLYELGALIVVAGIEAGFDVVTESKISFDTPEGEPKRTGKIDCAWFPKGKRNPMVVAWEIDAQDVKAGHLKGMCKKTGAIKIHGNKVKFERSGAFIKIQALYSIRGKILKKLMHAENVFPKGCGVDVYLDVELMEGKLLEIIEDAKHRLQIPLCPAEAER